MLRSADTGQPQTDRETNQMAIRATRQSGPSERGTPTNSTRPNLGVESSTLAWQRAATALEVLAVT